MGGVNVLQKLKDDALLFGKAINPQAFSVKSPTFHYELRDFYHSEEKKIVIQAPRGHAKTTIVGGIFALHHLVFEDRTPNKFILLISKTEGHAKRMLQTIGNILEYSNNFKKMFGYWGKQSSKKWAEREIILKDGSIIMARGMGQQIVGLKHLNQRPTFVVLDDPEDLNNTKTPEAMDHNLTILLKEILPALDAKIGRVFVIGTPQRQSCMVEKLMDMPGWTSKRYDAIVDEKAKLTLWPELHSWEKLQQEKEALESIGKLSIFYSEWRCFSKDTPVKLANGRSKQISKVEVGDKVYSDFGEATVIKSDAVGVDNLVNIRLWTGDEIKATLHHHWKVNGEMVETIDLEEVEVAMPNRYKAIQHTSAPLVWARLVGYNIRDGHAKEFMNNRGYKSTKVEFYAQPKEDIERIQKDIEFVTGKKYAIQYREIHDRPLHYIVVTGNNARKFIKKGCVTGNKVTQDFHIPGWVMQGSKGIKAEFLAGLYGAEATKPLSRANSNTLVNLKMEMAKRDITHTVLFEDILSLLHDFNLNPTFNIYPYKRPKTSGYKMVVLLGRREDQRRFFKHIGYRYSGHKERLAFSYAHYLKNKKNFRATTHDKWVRWRDDKLIIDVVEKTILPKEEVWNITVDSPDNSYYVGNISIDTYNCLLIGDEEQLFKPEYIKYWDGELFFENDEAFLKIERKGYNISEGFDYAPEMTEFSEPLIVPVNTFMGIDPASSIKKTADYSVIMPIAVDENKNIYILPYFHQRVTPMQLADNIVKYYKKYKPKWTSIETVGYQEMLRDYLRQTEDYMPGLETKNNPRSPKSTRLESMQIDFAQGRVYLMPDMADFRDELVLYPRARNDDFLDGLYYAKRKVWAPSHISGDKQEEEEIIMNRSKGSWLLA